MSEEIQRVLGFDWLLLFAQGHIHPSTISLALRLLLTMLTHPVAMQRFREGSHCGGWLTEAESVLQNRIGMVLGTYVSVVKSM